MYIYMYIYVWYVYEYISWHGYVKLRLDWPHAKGGAKALAGRVSRVLMMYGMSILCGCRKREAAFINGLPFEYHRVRSAEEIGELITEADQDTAHFQHQVGLAYRLQKEKKSY